MNSEHATKPTAATLARFAEIVGEKHAVWPGQGMRPFLVEWRDKYVGKSPLVLRPGNTTEVSEIVKLANETGTGLVPQGGNTGLVGGQIPFESGVEIIVSMGRMNRIRALDADNNTLIAEAGTILQSIQDAADEAGRFFPLSLGSEGSCQIGGNLSTNAGGTGVLSYGNARDLVLGLEMVLGNGDIWNGLRTLRKDNTGYDLKQLFIGAEGTLGLITAAALKLFAKPRSREVAFLGVASPQQAIALFHFVSAREGRRVTGFEIIPRIGLEFVLRHHQSARDPLGEAHPWYILFEA
ncbi:MAG: FAD-binding oxidoreductase, partial [Fimbriimonadaceae bacterium]|nr:FAD-binding oxidoreductase [Alphaproteobacteria bacterium]